MSIASSSSSSTSYYPDATQTSSNYATPMMNVDIMIIAMVVLVMVVIMVVVMHLYVRWVWGNSGFPYWEWGWGIGSTDMLHPDPMQEAAAGLEKAVVEALPTFVYRKLDNSTDESTECSVCISEFQENETGRLLPKCNHSFHTACIDVWFQSHSTCPLCRATVGEDQSIFHQKLEILSVNGDLGAQNTVPSHDQSSLRSNFAADLSSGMAAADQSNSNFENLMKSIMGMQEINLADMINQECSQSDIPHVKENIVSQSMQYPVNTLFYGNQNHVISHTTSRAERFKKLQHLVIEVPSRTASYAARPGARTSPPTPTSHDQSRGTPLSHFKAIKRILSMGDRMSTAPATSKSTDFDQATLTP